MARALTSIDLDGAITVNSDVMINATSVQVLCANVAGTSDGTIALHGSVDGTSYEIINFVGATLGVASPKASLTGADLNQVTIIDTLVAQWNLESGKFPYTKLVCIGTAADQTTITGFWSK